MNWLRILTIACVLSAPMAAPLAVRACPLCSEAIANSNDKNNEEETDQFPAAMNQSIYLMLAVPYTSLAVIGFLIYRGMKRNDEYRKSLVGQASSLPLAENTAG
jgi:hypothetical protein